MSCKLGDKCDNVFACNILRPNVELLGCNFYKPKKPMTNEEYLKSCNTEQLAEWIASVVRKAIYIKESNGIVMLESVVWWVEWLKQPHTNE